MSGDHAVLAPSSAGRRVHCPGSRALEATYPETEDSLESKEGTAAHWAATELFAGRTIDTGLLAPNGIMLTDEMVEAAEMFYADVISVYGEFAGFTAHVEERIDISVIHALCWGTPDAWIFKPRKLIVWDFKFGHRLVDVFENWQLLEYSAGILEKVGINGISDEVTEVEFRIVQPRCYVGGPPIRVWKVMAVDLRGYYNQLREAEARSMHPDAPTVVGEHCRDCKGRHACVSIQRAAYNAMDIAGSNVPFDLAPEALGAELRYIDRAIQSLEFRRTGLAEQALTLIKRGVPVSFYQAEPSMGRERWKVPDAEIITMGELMGLELSKPKLVTPKQAIKAGLDPTVVEVYSETPRGETKLVANDGKLARKVFGVTY
jgi:hypothetical protein